MPHLLCFMATGRWLNLAPGPDALYIVAIRLADGGFARVSTRWGASVLRVAVSERQRRGSIFAAFLKLFPVYLFIIPGLKHAWPKSAACWSPAQPAIGMGAPKRSRSVSA